MKRVVIFFLFLCTLLISRFNSAQASAHNYTIQNLSTQPVTKTQHIKSVLEQKGFTIDTNTDISDESDYLISDEDGDEEYITKSLQQAKFFLAFSFAFILSYCRNNIAERLPFCRHLSYISAHKYIVQRALRI